MTTNLFRICHFDCLKTIPHVNLFQHGYKNGFPVTPRAVPTSGGAIESQSWFLGEMVFSVKQVLWICLVSHLIILASCVKLQDFYPFGQANGDDELPAHGDDTASAVVDLSGSFMLYDKRYRRLSVSSLASSRAESDVEDYGGIFSITRTTSVRRIRRRF